MNILISLLFTLPVFWSTEEKNPVENVIVRAYNSIVDIQEGKVFINPERLSLNDGVIYLEDGLGVRFPVSIVFSIEHLPYIQISEAVLLNLWKCECGSWNHKWDNPTHCWRCARPR